MASRWPTLGYAVSQDFRERERRKEARLDEYIGNIAGDICMRLVAANVARVKSDATLSVRKEKKRRAKNHADATTKKGSFGLR